MRTTFMALCLILFAAVATAQDQAAPPQVVNAYDLNDGKAVITGRFGQPLGECVQLRAKVYRDERFKGMADIPVLRITHVNGKKLQHPWNSVEFEELAFAKGKIPRHKIGLIERGNAPSKLTDAQIFAAFENLTVGDVNLVAYETGGFYGEAKNLPKDIPERPPVQMRGPDTFHFKLSLIVVKVEDKPALQPQAPVQK